MCSINARKRPVASLCIRIFRNIADIQYLNTEYVRLFLFGEGMCFEYQDLKETANISVDYK